MGRDENRKQEESPRHSNPFRGPPLPRSSKKQSKMAVVNLASPMGVLLGLRPMVSTLVSKNPRDILISFEDPLPSFLALAKSLTGGVKPSAPDGVAWFALLFTPRFIAPYHR